MSGSTTESAGGPRPRLSVVVASSNHGELLARCLESLVTHAVPGEVEVVVVRDVERYGGVNRAISSADEVAVRWIEAPRGATVPQLRGLGLGAARGERIALLEDDCAVDESWCRVALDLGGADAAVGGAVEPGPYRRAIDWAVYFCEYGRFMLPVRTGRSAPLPGNNVVYSRQFLETLPVADRAEFREVFVHDAARRSGIPTRVEGALVVRNLNRWSWRHLTSVPFHHGRAYSAQRFGRRSAIGRAAVAFLALALPALKVARIAAGALSRGRFGGRLLQASPLILLFTVSWSAGEILGCLGGPGDSPSRWR